MNLSPQMVQMYANYQTPGMQQAQRARNPFSDPNAGRDFKYENDMKAAKARAAYASNANGGVKTMSMDERNAALNAPQNTQLAYYSRNIMQQLADNPGSVYEAGKGVYMPGDYSGMRSGSSIDLDSIKAPDWYTDFVKENSDPSSRKRSPGTVATGRV